MKIIQIYLYTTWFLILLPEFTALSDETESEVVTTKVASRFPVFVFSASIAISNIENKWIMKSCIQWIYWKCLKIWGMHIWWGNVFLNSNMYRQNISKNKKQKKKQKRLWRRWVPMLRQRKSSCKTANLLILDRWLTNVNSRGSSKQKKKFKLNTLYFIWS